MNKDLLEQFGLGTDDLIEQDGVVLYPETVKGRVAHIDADFLAYIASAEKADSQFKKSLTECKEHLHEMIEIFRQLAGAETVELHVTPTESDKGKRYEQAILKEYQGNRKNKEKPRYLHVIRDYMVKELGAHAHVTKEADDGLAEAQYKAVKSGNKDLSVIVTKDKDLRIVEGLHLDWDTGVIRETDATGYIEMTETKSGTKKLYGFGAMWFFAQLLMGDTADNISGLPLVSKHIINAKFPTQAVQKAIKVLQDPDATDKRKKTAQKTLLNAKDKKCGEQMAYNLLKDCKTIKDAFNVVSTCYKYAEPLGVFKHWKTGEPVTWKMAMLSEMQLLWMRRNDNPNDAVAFINEHCKKGQ